MMLSWWYPMITPLIRPHVAQMWRQIVLNVWQLRLSFTTRVCAGRPAATQTCRGRHIAMSNQTFPTRSDRTTNVTRLKNQIRSRLRLCSLADR
jgi:hypothetical protein